MLAPVAPWQKSELWLVDTAAISEAWQWKRILRWYYWDCYMRSHGRVESATTQPTRGDCWCPRKTRGHDGSCVSCVALNVCGFDEKYVAFQNFSILFCSPIFKGQRKTQPTARSTFAYWLAGGVDTLCPILKQTKNWRLPRIIYNILSNLITFVGAGLPPKNVCLAPSNPLRFVHKACHEASDRLACAAKFRLQQTLAQLMQTGPVWPHVTA